jgi:hypothetical protein
MSAYSHDATAISDLTGQLVSPWSDKPPDKATPAANISKDT